MRIKNKITNKISEENNQLFFYTSDISIATTLISSGFTLEVLDKSNPKKALFVFKRTEKIEKTIQNYWNDSLKVSPKKFFFELKTLKNQLYS